MRDPKDTVRKLLAKAESTPYEAEAKTAREHAERLIIRYGLSASELGEEEAREVFEREVVVLNIPKYLWTPVSNGLGLAITNLGTCAVFRQKKSFSMVLYGRPSDIAHASLLIHTLQVQMLRDLKIWWGKHKHEARYPAHRAQMKRGYASCWLEEIAERISQLHAEESTGIGAELVVHRGMQAREEYMRSHKVIKARKFGGLDDRRGAAEAMEAARKAHLGTDTVENARQYIEA